MKIQIQLIFQVIQRIQILFYKQKLKKINAISNTALNYLTQNFQCYKFNEKDSTVKCFEWALLATTTIIDVCKLIKIHKYLQYFIHNMESFIEQVYIHIMKLSINTQKSQLFDYQENINNQQLIITMLNAQNNKQTSKQSLRKMLGLLQITHFDLNRLNINQQVFLQLDKLLSSSVVRIKEYQHQVCAYFLDNSIHQNINTQIIDLFFRLLIFSGQYLVKILHFVNIRIYKNWLNQVDSLQKNEIKYKDLLKCPQTERKIFSKILQSLSHKKMQNLKILIIQEMQINNLQAITFLQCPALQEMIYDDNKITSLKCLDKTKFKCLKIFGFTNNKIIKIPSFRIKLQKELKIHHQGLQIQLTYYCELMMIWNNFSKFQNKKICTWIQIPPQQNIIKFISPINKFVIHKQIIPPSLINIKVDFDQQQQI